MPSRTLTFTEQNFACQIPYNWSLKKSSVFLVDAHRFYGGSIYIGAYPTPTPFQVDGAAFTQRFKAKLIADGCDIITESTAPFEGHPAYAITFHKMINEKSIYTHSINFLAGGFRYALEISQKDSDPSHDSQLLAALNSFHLIGDP